MTDTWSTSFPTQQPVQMPQPTTPAVAAQLDDPLSDNMKARLRLERLPETPDGVLMLWERVKKALEEIKIDEMDIRKTAVKVYVPKGHEGTNNVELGSGFTLKAVIKYNYKLDSDNNKVEAALDAVAAVGNEGKFIAERLVNWTPSLSLSEYRMLVEDAKNSAAKKEMLDAINLVLTITDGAPTLEIKEPKAKKK
jgi:hypothetical protein